MTKLDVSLKTLEQAGVDQVWAKQAVQATLDSIIEAVATEGHIEPRDFGVFEVRVVKAHKARNPKTGGKVMAPERRWVRFKAGKVVADLQPIQARGVPWYPAASGR